MIHWIPVTDQLPKYDSITEKYPYVLVYIKIYDHIDDHNTVQMARYARADSKAKYDPTYWYLYGLGEVQDDTKELARGRITHWAPLPEFKKKDVCQHQCTFTHSTGSCV